MSTFTISTDVLHSQPAERYFVNADRRVMIGLRATLEMLGLPVPEYAVRRPSGPTPAKSVVAAFRADNPPERNYQLPPRRPNAAKR